MKSKSKAEVFIGFCIKAGKLKMGANALKYTKDRLYLVLLDISAGESTAKDAKSISVKNRCPLMLIKGVRLEDITRKENCKLAGVTDAGLAEAIKNNKDENFCLFDEGQAGLI